MSIIEDFASLNVELSKLEQAKMPTVQPDFSNSGDVTDEARNSFYAMYGYPTGGTVSASSLQEIEDTFGC
jgi:hypothetical protein